MSLIWICVNRSLLTSIFKYVYWFSYENNYHSQCIVTLHKCFQNEDALWQSINFRKLYLYIWIELCFLFCKHILRIVVIEKSKRRNVFSKIATRRTTTSSNKFKSHRYNRYIHEAIVIVEDNESQDLSHINVEKASISRQSHYCFFDFILHNLMISD